MLNKIAIKRSLRKISGWSGVCLHKLKKKQPAKQICIFYFHRITDLNFIDSQIDDRNISPLQFEKQIKCLREFAEIVPLPKLPEILESSEFTGNKPLVCLTFDDGYANFKTNVLPILKKYNVPATLSLVTQYIESFHPTRFDRWAQKNIGRISEEAWKILNWREVEECVASGLVTLASHSHSHLKANKCLPDQLKQEAEISAEILKCHFGSEHSQIFVYPFGNSSLGHVSSEYEKAVREAGFTIGLTTDVGLALPGSNYLRLPRLELHELDTAATLRAKADGIIAPLYLNNLFHKASTLVLKNKSKRKVESGLRISQY